MKKMRVESLEHFVNESNGYEIARMAFNQIDGAVRDLRNIGIEADFVETVILNDKEYHRKDLMIGKDSAMMAGEKTEKTVAYIHGKFFDSVEEMLEYATIWPDLPVDLKNYKDFLDQKFRELELNTSMRGMTNREAFLLLRLSTDWAVGSTQKRKSED